MALREWTIIGCVLGLSCGPADAGASECVGERVVLTSAALDGHQQLEVECLVIARGSTITITERATTSVRARAVVIEGAATIQGVGGDGDSYPPWTSGGPSCGWAHANWDEAVSRVDFVEPSTAGAPGGSFVLRYGRIAGGNERLALLRFDLSGGRGGRGRELRCGCDLPSHVGHVSRATDGPNGLPGTWRFVEEP